MSLDNLNNNIYPLSLDGLTTINADFITVNGATLDPNSYVPYVGASAAVNLGNNKITTVYIPVNPEDLVNKFFTDGKYATIASLAAYLTTANAASTYLTQSSAASTYATITSLANYLLSSTAASTYLTQSSAASTYQTQASLPSYAFTGTPTIIYAPGATDDSDKIPTTHWVVFVLNNALASYLTTANAASTYLTQADAASTYLTQASASSTYATITSLANYLTTANAASTYLTISNASSTYATITSLSNYLTNANAASTYLTISNASSTYATITNLNLKANSANPVFTGTTELSFTTKFTITPSPGTVSFYLAVDSGNNIIRTLSAINQTATFTSSPSTYYLPFVSSASTGAFAPLVNAGIMCDPYNGLIKSSFITATNTLETYNMKITNVPTGTQLYLLAVDSAGNVIRGTAGGTAPTMITPTLINTNTTLYPVFLSSNAGGASTTYTETDGALSYNPSTNILTTGQLNITTVPTGTQQYLLAVNSAGNVIRGTITPLQQVRTLVNADYYIPFVSSFTNGDFLPLIENRVKLNPSTGTISMFNLVLSGNANLASITFNSIPPAGTVSSYLAINSSGNIITTAAAGGDAYLANNQTFTGSNTFDSPLMCNNINPKPLHGLIIDGNGNGIVVFRSLGITKARVDNYGFDADIISNITLYTQNVTSPFSTSLTLTGANDASLYSSGTNNYGCNTSHQFTVNSVNNFAISADGLWMPKDASKSFYITDTYPNIGTTCYGRYFGVANGILQDFYNAFLWRRASNANGSGLADAMILNGSGLFLESAANLGHPQLTFSGTPNISATGSGYNWYIGGLQVGSFDYPGTSNWRISTNLAQKLILCSGYQNTLQCGNGGLGHYPVEIYGYRTVLGSYWQYTGGGATWAAQYNYFNVGLWVQYTVSADGGYILASDERIKKNIKPAENGSLDVIKTIPIKSYGHIDSFLNGVDTAFNVTAQDIQKTYPEACSSGVGFIPDMYVKCNWITVNDKEIEINIPKDHTVIVGDKVKLILEDSNHKEAIVTAIKDKNTFVIEKWDEFKLEISDELFVYGKNVDDFLRVDKTKLGVLALAGVKELNSIVEKQEKQISDQKEVIKNQEERIKHLEESILQHNILLSQIVDKLNSKN